MELNNCGVKNKIIEEWPGQAKQCKDEIKPLIINATADLKAPH